MCNNYSEEILKYSWYNIVEKYRGYNHEKKKFSIKHFFVVNYSFI